MIETIEIALAADGRYFCGLFVTACSIAEHANKDVELSYNILDGGIAAADRLMLENKVKALHPLCAFNYILVNEADFSDCPTWNGSRMIYTRLMLPKLLPGKDWVIYCDVDFLWLRDIMELWCERDDHYAFVGVLDPVASTAISEEKWCTEHGLACSVDEYCCAGLSFLNLKMFREQGLFDWSMRINALHPPYNDQTIFNVVAQGRKKLVPETWQCFTQKLTQERLNEGVVIHYAGEIPWKFVRRIQVLSDTMLIWHRFNARYRGVSLWRSLRMHFGLLQLLWHRGLHWFFRTPLLKQMLKLCFAVIGHPGVYDVFAMRTRKFHIRYAV